MNSVNGAKNKKKHKFLYFYGSFLLTAQNYKFYSVNRIHFFPEIAIITYLSFSRICLFTELLFFIYIFIFTFLFFYLLKKDKKTGTLENNFFFVKHSDLILKSLEVKFKSA